MNLKYVCDKCGNNIEVYVCDKCGNNIEVVYNEQAFRQKHLCRDCYEQYKERSDVFKKEYDEKMSLLDKEYNLE